MNYRHANGCDCQECCKVDAYHEALAQDVETFIERQSYEWKREQCDMYRTENRLRGWKRRERFSAWLRDRVEDQLIAADRRANEDWC